MKYLQVIVIVAIGSVFFSSCSNQYGCPYNTFNDTGLEPVTIDKTVPAQRPEKVHPTVAIAR